MGSGAIAAAPDIGVADGLRFHRRWRGHVRSVRHLRRSLEARLSMLVAGLYIAATVAVTVYMLVALLRPEDF
jgi:hypothetical protein